MEQEPRVQQQAHPSWRATEEGKTRIHALPENLAWMADHPSLYWMRPSDSNLGFVPATK
jgi:hypothetical protein